MRCRPRRLGKEMAFCLRRSAEGPVPAVLNPCWLDSAQRDGDLRQMRWQDIDSKPHHHWCSQLYHRIGLPPTRFAHVPYSSLLRLMRSRGPDSLSRSADRVTNAARHLLVVVQPEDPVDGAPSSSVSADRRHYGPLIRAMNTRPIVTLNCGVSHAPLVRDGNQSNWVRTPNA